MFSAKSQGRISYINVKHQPPSAEVYRPENLWHFVTLSHYDMYLPSVQIHAPETRSEQVHTKKRTCSAHQGSIAAAWRGMQPSHPPMCSRLKLEASHCFAWKTGREGGALLQTIAASEMQRCLCRLHAIIDDDGIWWLCNKSIEDVGKW